MPDEARQPAGSQATNAQAESPLKVDRRNVPYQRDAGVGSRARIGLLVLASDHAIEFEFRQMVRLPGVDPFVSRVRNASKITPETLAAMEKELAGATELLLPGIDMDVIGYGCTSGAMTIGPAVVAERVREAQPGVPVTDPMTAAFAAFRAMGATRIALLAPYMNEINQSMRRYLMDNGFDVPALGSWNESDDNDVAHISPASIAELALDIGGSDDVDAVFVSCTSLRVAGVAEGLEAKLGKPVTSSNHALAWHCLRLAGVDDAIGGLGRLFRLPAPQAAS